MTKVGVQLASCPFLLCLLNGLSGCDDFCIGECTGPAGAEGGGTSNPGDGDGAGDGVDETGGDATPDLCSYPALAGLDNCVSVPYLAMPLRGTDTVPPSSTYTVENIEGLWERSTYGYDEWAKLQGHLDFRGGVALPTQGRTHFSIMAATDACSEGWWSMTTDIHGPAEIPVLGSEVLMVDGKEVIKVDHLVPDPTVPTTTVQIVWFVELCDPYVYIVDAEGGVMSPSTFSNPGGAIVQSDPGGSFEVIMGMGAVVYGTAT